MSKHCSKCRHDLPTSAFGKWKYGRDGLRNWCRKCRAKDRREKRISSGQSVRIVRDPAHTAAGFRQCTKCYEIKHVSLFGSKTTARLPSWCCACRAALEAESRRVKGIPQKPKRDPKLAAEGLKQCLLCFNVLPFVAFQNNVRGASGLAAYCQTCNQLHYYNREKARIYQQAYRENNAEYAARHRLHQHRRRQKTQGPENALTGEDAKKLYAKKRCSYCRAILTTKTRTIDHVIPLARGGQHAMSNLVAACRECNCSKGAKTKEEFLTWRRERCKTSRKEHN